MASPPGARRCPRCAAAVSSDTAFCGACGNSLSGESAPAEAACPRCGAANPPLSAFCGECGTNMAASQASRMCPRCRTANPPLAGFCGSCGAGLEPSTRSAPPIGTRLQGSLGKRGGLVAGGAVAAVAAIVAVVAFSGSGEDRPAASTGGTDAIAALDLSGEFAQPVETRTLSVAAAGGSLALGDGAELVVQPGALPTGTSVTVQRYEPGIEYLAFTVARSAIYQVRADLPAGGAVAVPVELRIPGPAERSAVLEFAGGQWTPIPSTPAGDSVTVMLDHFSLRSIMAVVASGVSGLRTIGESVASSVPRWDLRDDVQAMEAAHRTRIQARAKPTRDFFGVGETTARTHADLCGEFRTVVTARKQSIEFGIPPGSPGVVQLTKHLGDAGKPSAGDSSARWYWDATSKGHADLRARIVQAGAGSRITPAQVLGLAIDVYGGNIPLAVLAVQNVLKDIAYEGRTLADPVDTYKGGIQDISSGDAAVAASIETWRKQADHSPSGRYDKLGPLYHIFAGMTARLWGGPAFGQSAITIEALLRGFGWGPDIPDPDKGAADECGLEIGAWLEELKGEFDIFFQPSDETVKAGKPVALTLVVRNLPEAGLSLSLAVVEGKASLSTPGLSVSRGGGSRGCDHSVSESLCGFSVTPGEDGKVTVEARSGNKSARITLDGKVCIEGVPRWHPGAEDLAANASSQSFTFCIPGAAAPAEGTITVTRRGEDFFRFGNGPKEDVCTYEATLTFRLTGSTPPPDLRGAAVLEWAYNPASLQGACASQRAQPTRSTPGFEWTGTYADRRLRIQVGTPAVPDGIVLEGVAP